MASTHGQRRSQPPLRDRLLRMFRCQPYLSTAQTAAIVGCHPSTAARYLNPIRARLRQPPAAAARSSDTRTRQRTAGAPACSPRLLVRFAVDPELRVRAAAASNPACPVTSLGRLHRDPSRALRPAAAFCAPWTSPTTHPQLLLSDAFDVNPGCPPRLTALIQHEAVLAGLGA